MQLVRSFEPESSAQVGFGVRVLLVSADDQSGLIASRLASLGSMIECATEVFTGLEAMHNDPAGYELFVLDCDTCGGIETGIKAVSMLAGTSRHIPAILVSQDCKLQVFSEDPNKPTILRAPLTAVSLRVGFEHALRDRLAMRMI